MSGSRDPGPMPYDGAAPEDHFPELEPEEEPRGRHLADPVLRHLTPAEAEAIAAELRRLGYEVTAPFEGLPEDAW